MWLIFGELEFCFEEPSSDNCWFIKYSSAKFFTTFSKLLSVSKILSVVLSFVTTKEDETDVLATELEVFVLFDQIPVCDTCAYQIAS